METPASSDLGRLLGPLLPYAEDEDKDKEAFAKFSPTIDSARAMVSKLFDASIVISTGVKDQQLKSTSHCIAEVSADDQAEVEGRRCEQSHPFGQHSGSWQVIEQRQGSA